jgi:hypothetical protein
VNLRLAAEPDEVAAVPIVHHDKATMSDLPRDGRCVADVRFRTLAGAAGGRPGRGLRASASPGQQAALDIEVVEDAGGAIVGQGGEVDHRLGALLRRAEALVS